MIVKTISHYPPKADPIMAGKILEKPGEGCTCNTEKT
jgi:hypothetical protein